MSFTILSETPSVIECEAVELDEDGNEISREMIIKNATEVEFEFINKNGATEKQKYRFDNDLIVDGDVTPNVSSIIEQIIQ